MNSAMPSKLSLGTRLEAWWLTWKARMAIVLNQKPVALAFFDDILRISPENHHAAASRAFLLAEMGRHAEAIVQLEQLLAQNPNEASNWFNLGFLLDAAGQDQRAFDAMEKATQLNSHLDRAFYGLALSAIKLGKTDIAIAALQRNTQLQPMSPHGWYQLAMVHFKQQEFSEASRIIRHLSGFEPKVAAQLRRETGLTDA
jgi:tetratricopeptide (TPR) repeat protein